MKTSKQIQLIVTELRARLVLCLVLVACCVGMVLAAIAQTRALHQEHLSAQQALREMQAKGHDLRDQLGHAKAHLARFETLTDLGAIGGFAKQRRLDEVDAIFRSGTVTPKAYALGAEATLTMAGAQGLQHTVSEHRMTFEVAVPHELRLVEIIERLASAEVGGLKGVEQCEVRRNADADKPDKPASTSRLLAACHLAWYRFEKKLEPTPGPAGLSPLQQASLPKGQP
jgi:hypothetical protein